MEISLLNKNIIKLKLIPGIGDVTIAKIIENSNNFAQQDLQFEFIKEYLSVKQTESFKSLEKNLNSLSDKVVLELYKNKINLVNITNSEYPESLKKTFSPPPLLFCKGNLEYEYYKSLSVVGTRAFSSYGERECERFVEILSQNNFSIISGLALGIDAIAHRSALKTSQAAKCIAVVGNGLSTIYPASNANLFQKILDSNGCIISQFLPHEEAKRENFPLRNKIIAGLSRGTLVIEAADKSGSLITANFAFEYDREVYALPADLHRKNSEGCNILIKNQIAKLITNPEDILSDFGLLDNKGNDFIPKQVLNTNLEFKEILDLLSFESLTSDQISIKLNMDIHSLGSLLSEIELEGLVTRDEQSKWIRI